MARRRSGRRRASVSKDQKVTARFSDAEYEQLVRLSRERGEKMSAMLRSLILDTIDEVAEGLEKKRR